MIARLRRRLIPWTRRRPLRGGVERGADDRGAVAAELALALPAVALTLLLGAGAIGAASRQVVLQDAAADAARLLGRGESASVATGAVTSVLGGADVASSQSGDLVCVTARIEVAVGASIRVPLQASSCALTGGR